MVGAEPAAPAYGGRVQDRPGRRALPVVGTSVPPGAQLLGVGYGDRHDGIRERGEPCGLPRPTHWHGHRCGAGMGDRPNLAWAFSVVWTCSPVVPAGLQHAEV